MRFTSAALAVGLAIVVTGCGTPPTADIDAAKASVEKAASSGASQYAPDSYKAAEDARAALDAELKAQDGKMFKSYDKAKDLAAAAKAAGDKANTEAMAGKEKADAAAAAKAKAAAARAAAREVAKKEAVPVGGAVKPPVKVKDVAPIYPEIARTAKVSGVVVIQATIGADGKVADTKVVKSVPMLDQAAVNAVEQWEYTPSTRGGKPVPVIMTVTVNFAKP
jgi:protein TonB